MASLRSKIESALAASLAGAAENIYKGFDYNDKVLPVLIVAARSAEEDFANSGNYRVTCDLIVKGNAEAGTAFEDLADAVSSVVKTDEFAASLISDGLHVWGVSAPDRVEWGMQGESWTETRTIEIYCCPQTFAA